MVFPPTSTLELDVTCDTTEHLGGGVIPETINDVEDRRDEEMAVGDKKNGGEEAKICKSRSLGQAHYRCRSPVTNASSSHPAYRRSTTEFVVNEYLELHNEEWIPIIGEQDTDEALEDGQIARLMVVIGRAYREAHPVVQNVVGIGSCFFTYGIMHTLDDFTSNIAVFSVILIVGTSSPHLTLPAGVGAIAVNENTTLAWLTLLGVITSAVLLIAERHKFLVGYSGRGGVLAFIANNITMIIMMASGSISWNLYGDRSHLWKEVLTWEPSIVLVLGSFVTSGICGVYRIQSHVPLNPLLSLSAVALFLILLITATQYQYADEWSSGVCTGAFVAMGSMENLPTLRAFVLSGFLGGLYNLFWSPFFTGFSGDISPFCGYVTYHWIVRFVNQLTSQTPNIRNEGCKPPGVIWIDKSQVMT